VRFPRFPAPAVGLPLLICITAASAHEPPLRALLICGGCCHDYEAQSALLRDGIQSRANVQVDVIRSADTGTSPWFSVYDDPEWAKGYDVIIHDECAADTKDAETVANILTAHKNGAPAVNLHCAMHSYRTGDDSWFAFLGLQSTSHGWQKPIDIDFSIASHSITATHANWSTGNEELYNSVKVFETATPLALGTQPRNDGATDTAVVVWTNDYHGTRVFGTTLGHNNQTVGDARYLDLVVRGLLWSCDKLEDEAYLKPYAGPKGRTTVVSGKKPTAEIEVPEGATHVTVSASSVQNGNWRGSAVDGKRDTRWCADGGSFPQWIQLELDQAKPLEGVDIVWESNNNAYRHLIEGSLDGKEWTPLTDARENRKPGDTRADFEATPVKFLRITCTGTSQGGWASIREITVRGDGIGPLFAAIPESERNQASNQFAKSGNIIPKAVKLTAEEEAAMLRDVKVADGFDVSLFATSASANYPVFVAAAPNGDLYVSSDGNGSLGRDPHRGRIIRLRDTDRDGRADLVTEFVKDVDSPRGLVWDHDRLYLIHPPHVSAFIDHDGDGQADEEKRLISGIAFGFEDRPADHTTNGLVMGVDGWLYVAGGDFGFMEAVGTDGRRVQHRNGGVLRFRPDGSGLEIFSTGTRNIVGTPISPLLDLFSRDNTNDGGGWDVRFHHFTGLEDHGYPRMYINFADEIVAPLADYGGGSGCGSTYLSEPGFPEKWNHAPLTCDWGTGALWKHTVAPRGATFAETAKPEPLIRMTRPTDTVNAGIGRAMPALTVSAAFFRRAGKVRLSPGKARMLDTSCVFRQPDSRRSRCRISNIPACAS
jgi:putative membrane-bound dehydrogenase-like protein